MRSLSQCALCFLALSLFQLNAVPNASAQAECETLCHCTDCPIKRSQKEGRWFVVESTNFTVRSDDSKLRTEDLARHAEQLLGELSTKWLGIDSHGTWQPSCEIVLHSNLQSYVTAVGRGSERTVGSSLVNAERGAILKRRIDLLGGKVKFLSAALPHELTHIVLRDRFVNNPPPRWADEGIALLVDPADKKQRHRNDLDTALKNGSSFSASALLTLDDYPSRTQFGVFYGQSASLTEFLVSKGTPHEFVNFVAHSQNAGYTEALKACYGIPSVGALDRQWRQSLKSESARRLLSSASGH